MKKIEAIQNAFLILSIPQAISTVIALVVFMIGVIMLLRNNPFFGILFGVMLAIVAFAIIAIFVQLKKIENDVSFDEAKSQCQLDEWCSGVINDSRHCYDIINFHLHIDSKATSPVSVKSINCMFMYNDVIMQNMTVQNGNIFATNGIEVNLVTIEPQKGNDQICPLNPFPYIPILPESNEEWRIKGVITFQWFFVTFEKRFDIKVPISTPERWRKSRSKYQELYNLVFDTMEGKSGRG
jgi:hypothetical protein